MIEWAFGEEAAKFDRVHLCRPLVKQIKERLNLRYVLEEKLHVDSVGDMLVASGRESTIPPSPTLGISTAIVPCALNTQTTRRMLSNSSASTTRWKTRPRR